MAGASYSFGAVADAFVDSAKPTTSHGDWGQLLVVGQSAGSTKQGLVRFNVSGLPAGAQVRSARLRLSVTNDSTSGGSIYALASNSWSESVTWNSRPSLSGTALASLGSVAQGQVVEVDLSGLVTGNGSYSFAIVHPSNNNNHLGYGSREASASSSRPLLILTTE
jgi:acid phosphatase type 7